MKVLAVYWQWEPGTPHAGGRFWGCHNLSADGRARDWPRMGLRAIGAAEVEVTEGEGLDLVARAAALSAGQIKPEGE